MQDSCWGGRCESSGAAQLAAETLRPQHSRLGRKSQEQVYGLPICTRHPSQRRAGLQTSATGIMGCQALGAVLAPEPWPTPHRKPAAKATHSPFARRSCQFGLRLQPRTKPQNQPSLSGLDFGALWPTSFKGPDEESAKSRLLTAAAWRRTSQQAGRRPTEQKPQSSQASFWVARLAPCR